MKKEERCPKCGEQENLHFNYDYSTKGLKVEEILCNECGEFWTPICTSGEMAKHDRLKICYGLKITI